MLQVSWSPDSKQLLSASGDKTCKIWNVETGEMVSDFVMGTEVEDQQVSCIWAGEHLVSISLSGFINYLNPADPSKPKKIIKVCWIFTSAKRYLGDHLFIVVEIEMLQHYEDESGVERGQCVGKFV